MVDREYVENQMKEQVRPRLVKMGYIPEGLEFKYSNRLEMSNKDKIALYQFLTDRYEIPADDIDKEFVVSVVKQLNLMEATGGVGGGVPNHDPTNPRGGRKMTHDEYFMRYGKTRAKLHFLTERR